MKKVVKYILIAFLVGILFMGYRFYKFIDRAINGVPIFETDSIALQIDTSKFNILLNSKTNGFIHKEAIETSIPIFKNMALKEGWDLHVINSGAVFNEDQLSKFDVVIWNNTTGKILTDPQRESFKKWILNGGGFVAVHGAGDFSHKWDWYYEEVMKTTFSHHSMDPQIQDGTLTIEPVDSADMILIEGLDQKWTLPDEWYVFNENPRATGVKVLYTLDESKIVTSGNFLFLVKDKDFGMGSDHPAVWYHRVGNGKYFYSSLGHNAGSFNHPMHQQMLKNAILWAGR